MKDIHSNWLMQWLKKKGLPEEKTYEYLGYAAFGCFWLGLLPAILVPEEGGFAAVLCMIACAACMAASGYLAWLANGLWLPLVLVGPVNIIMGLAIDMGTLFRVLFVLLGIAFIGVGLWLMPIQRRNHKQIKQQLKQEQDQQDAQLVQKLRQQQRREAPKDPVLSAKMKVRTLSDIKYNAESREQKAKAEAELAQASKQLGELLLQQEQLWVLNCDFPGGKPAYLGMDGRLELFTKQALAEAGQKALLEQVQVKTLPRLLAGEETIRAFFTNCAHNGLQVLRLDNGSPSACELWLRDFFTYRAADIIDEKNRELRHMFLRAKQYQWQRGSLADLESPTARNLAQIMLTMKFNGFRCLGNGLVYALADPTEEDRVYATEAALKLLEKWLPGSGYEQVTDLHAPSCQKNLHLCYVNKPGEQGKMETGMVCVFTDLPQAKAGQALFRHSGMDSSVVTMTWQELAGRAVQCAGIVVDMQTLSFEIAKEEFGTVGSYAALDGPIVVQLKESQQQAPKLMQTELKNGWMRWDYRWPYRFGYDYMLRSAQWLKDNHMDAMTLTTAGIAGAPETDHTEQLRKGGKLSEIVGQETGVLAIGGSCDGMMVKICWYNQTNVVRAFTLGEVPQEKMDGLMGKLLEQK